MTAQNFQSYSNSQAIHSQLNNIFTYIQCRLNSREINMRSLRNFQVFLDDNSDPRVKNWFMMSSPLPTLAIVLCYFVFVKVSFNYYVRNIKRFKVKFKKSDAS